MVTTLTISIDELKTRFGPPINVAPYGECIIVPGIEFDPDWEAELADQGYKCFLSEISGRPITLVKLNRAVPEGKVVYVPPTQKVNPAPAATPQSTTPEKKKYALKGPTWTPEDEAELLITYDHLVSEGKKRGAVKTLIELPRFKERSISSLEQKIKRLLKKRKRTNALKPEKSVLAGPGSPNAEADDFIVELWKAKQTYDGISKSVKEKFPGKLICVDYRITLLKKAGRIQARHKINQETPKKSVNATKPTTKAQLQDIEDPQEAAPKNAEKLSEAYDSLSTAYVELKEDFDTYAKMQSEISEAQRENLKVLTEKLQLLQKKLALHKHDPFSGQSTIPLEA